MSIRRHIAVLLVDSFVDEREMYAEYLALQGFRVTACRDAAQALRAVRSLRPDVIVLRRRTPTGAVMGDDMTVALRAESATATTPIIALVSTIGVDPQRAVMEAGADEFVLIPCLPDDLAERIRGIVARSGRVDRATRQ